MSKSMAEMYAELEAREQRRRMGFRDAPPLIVPDIPDDADVFNWTMFMGDIVERAGLRNHIRRWSADHSGHGVSEFVENFEHRVLSVMTPGSVLNVLEHSSHALGRLEKERDTERFISLANPPWAMTYLFHVCMERVVMRVPTWGEFYEFVTGRAASKWWTPVQQSASSRRVNSDLARRAATWRLATAWQSMVRTVVTLAELRHTYGIPARYHLLAHVELRIDGWHDGRAYRLVMPNEYESGKVDPREIFAGGDIRVHDVTVSAHGERGEVWMPSRREWSAAADFLSGRGSAEQGALFW